MPGRGPVPLLRGDATVRPVAARTVEYSDAARRTARQRAGAAALIVAARGLQFARLRRDRHRALVRRPPHDHQAPPAEHSPARLLKRLVALGIAVVDGDDLAGAVDLELDHGIGPRAAHPSASTTSTVRCTTSSQSVVAASRSAVSARRAGSPADFTTCRATSLPSIAANRLARRRVERKAKLGRRRVRRHRLHAQRLAVEHELDFLAVAVDVRRPPRRTCRRRAASSGRPARRRRARSRRRRPTRRARCAPSARRSTSSAAGSPSVARSRRGRSGRRPTSCTASPTRP